MKQKILALTIALSLAGFQSPLIAATLMYVATIESSTSLKEPAPFTFTGTANTESEVKYSATLFSKDDVVLFKMKGREEHRSLDSLTRIIGRDIGKHVAKCYK